MHKYMVLSLAAAFYLVALSHAKAHADVVRISEVGEGTPVVHVIDASGNDVTAQRVTILGDTGNEFLHFDIALPAGVTASGAIGQTTLYEDVIGGTVSDLFKIGGPAGATFLEVSLGSDPNLNADPRQGFNLGHDAVETGDFQLVADGNGAVDLYYVQSDAPESIPEPASLTLIGMGIMGIAGYGLRRRKRRPLAA